MDTATFSSVIKYTPISLTSGPVHHALRPVLARAYLGFDKDCRELIDHLTTKWHQPVRVDECITAIFCLPRGGAWSYVAVRCLRCVLKNRTCDLVFRAKLPVCTCDWLMSFDHRDLIMERNRLLNEYRVHFSKPWSMRAPDMEVMSFLHRLTSIEDWFGRMVSNADLLPLSCLQTYDSTVACCDWPANHPWYIPDSSEWRVCPCSLLEECDGDNHPDRPASDDGGAQCRGWTSVSPVGEDETTDEGSHTRADCTCGEPLCEDQAEEHDEGGDGDDEDGWDSNASTVEGSGNRREDKQPGDPKPDDSSVIGSPVAAVYDGDDEGEAPAAILASLDRFGPVFASDSDSGDSATEPSITTPNGDLTCPPTRATSSHSERQVNGTDHGAEVSVIAAVTVDSPEADNMGLGFLSIEEGRCCSGAVMLADW